MAEKLSNEEASALLRNWLVGASFDKLSYLITGWELRFLGAEAGEYLLFAAELTAAGTDALETALLDAKVPILDTTASSDGLVAAQLFSALNKWRISRVDIDSLNNLSITFENSVQIEAQSKVTLVDWTWSVTAKNDLKQVTSDSGPISVSDIEPS